MALFFNLHNLELDAGSDQKRFMMLLTLHYTKRLPDKPWQKSRLPLNGFSYMLNPAPIFNNKNIDIAHIIQYIKLAGRRDYALYILNKVITLDLSYFPDLDTSKILANPLLKILNKQIHFKYEEEFNGNRIW
jgi:hypothetical protein